MRRLVGAVVDDFGVTVQSPLAHAAIEAVAEANARERWRRVRAGVLRVVATCAFVVSLAAAFFGAAALTLPVAAVAAWVLAAPSLKVRWARIRREARLSAPIDVLD
jgi:Sec-independent protein secretion pathway component TatC